MTNKIFPLYVTLLLFLFIGDLHALETDLIQGEGVNVRFEKPLRKVAREVIRLYPSVKREIEEIFKSDVQFTPTVMIIKDSNTFQGIAGNGPIVAIALSGHDLIIIDNSRMKTYPFTLRATLKHEMCHLFLHNYIKGRRLARWLNEGISQWVSDGMAEVIIGENKNLLKQATLSGKLIRLEDIEKTFPADRRSLLLAYEESKSVVEYIVAEFGPDGIRRILAFLRDGFEIDDAVLKGLAISLNELENQWHEHLRRKTTWFLYISSHLYQILFVFAALLLTYGFIRVKVKMWTYKDNDEEDTDSNTN